MKETDFIGLRVSQVRSLTSSEIIIDVVNGHRRPSTNDIFYTDVVYLEVIGDGSDLENCVVTEAYGC